MNLMAIFEKDLNVLFGIIFCSLFLYGLTLNNGYSVDDYLVSENLEMVNKGISGIPEIVTSYYGKTDLGTPYAYRPITRITFAIERSLWGEKLWLSHLVNVLLYALLSFLAFLLLMKIVGEKNRALILVTIGLFVFHPIHTEVVCSLKNREEILSLTFVLAASILLLKFIDEGKLKLLPIALALFLLSLPTKVSNVPYAGILTLSVFLFRKWNFKTLFSAGAPFLAVFAGYLLTVYHYFPLYLRKEFTPEESPLMFVPSIWDRIPTGLGVIPVYAKMVSIPHPLAFFYGYNQIEIMHWNDGFVWLGIGMLLTLTAIFLLCIKKAPAVSFGIGIFGMGIAPFLNIVAGVPGIVAERWLLTPSLGICLILAWFLWKVFLKAGSKPFIALFSLILISYSIRTISRVPDWKSHRSLIYHDVNVVPKSFVANYLAGKYYSIDGYSSTTQDAKIESLKKSLFYYNTLIDLAENKAEYQLRCAYISADINNKEDAIAYSKKAFENRDSRLTYGLKALEILLQIEQPTLGIELSEILATENPENSAPLIFHGNFHLMAGDTSKAIIAYERALQLSDVETSFISYVNNLKNQKQAR